ncbi:MAG: hypothetical protein WDZ82_01260 [Candidatus Paceibacterota bacterium]
MKIKRKYVAGSGTVAIALLAPRFALAHCPLCTAGAGVLAVGASYVGLSTAVVGVLIGAFALALGYWLAGMIKNQYVSYQYGVIVTLTFLLTVIPIMPLIREYRPVYLPFIGEYGTTYTLNIFLVGSILGALIVASAPYVSKGVTQMREGARAPYQGVTVTIALLVLVSVVIQFIV